jgi:[protein-PII] uridylyltransferase
MPSSPVEKLKAERERLREEHRAGASGLIVVRALSEATDRAIRDIWSSLQGTDGAALVATGGYGRGELSPHSDIDLMVLHPKPDRVEQAVKALSYELWDAGLEFAQAVYTPKESLRLAQKRFDVKASFMITRLVAGDPDRHETWRQAKDDWIDQTSDEGSRLLRRAIQGWRRAGGDAGADLEPNLKDGRGGLRDLRMLTISVSLDKDPRLEESADFIHRVRNELHFVTGRRTDTLTMQLLSEAARALQPTPHPSLDDLGLGADDELLRNVYVHARYIGAYFDYMFAERDDGVWFPVDKYLKALPEVQLGTIAPTEAYVWNDSLFTAFLEILKTGDAARSIFGFMATFDQERFFRLIPEWRPIYCLPQRNVYHRFAVDTHSVEVVIEASRLSSSEAEIVGRVVKESSDDTETLLLAALLHDIGKGSPGSDHGTAGADLARAVLNRMGVSAEVVTDVEWLIRHHLVLSDIATRRDLGDERQIIDLAERVGSQRRLRLLFLLSLADGVATGPAAWGPWKATLVSRLFTRVSHLLEHEELVGRDAAKDVHEKEEWIRRALASYPSEPIEAHLRDMPRMWLLSQPHEMLVEQTILMLDSAPGGRRDAITVHTMPQTEAGIWEVTIVALDRAGLFSKIAGCLALHGLNVLGAQIYTREDGVALDIFRVEALGDEEHRFDRFEHDLREALRGRIAIDQRLAQKREDYAGRFAKGKREPPEVRIDNVASDFYTVIEVHAADRVGLLYDITRALADLELDVHLAKVSTYAEDVVDVFYVRDLEGQKVVEADFLKEIERAILFRIERP